MLIKLTRQVLPQIHNLSKALLVTTASGRNNFQLKQRNLMMASAADFERIDGKAALAEKILADLQSQIEAIRKAAIQSAGLEEEKQLIKENEELRKEIESVKTALFLAEVGNGVRQVQLPTKAALSAFSTQKLNTSDSVKVTNQVKQESVPQSSQQATEKKIEDSGKKTKQKESNSGEPVNNKKAKKEKIENVEESKNAGDTSLKKKANAESDSGDGTVDVSRLDLRIGKIVSVEKHPDADSLYVEKVDVGEGHHRTVVSGLVKHVPINAMKDRIAVFMCNLKPAKMRGVLSEGMIMCASGAEKTEILVPPTDSVIGDRVTCEEYPGTPDVQLNPKKKIWETLKPDVRTNADRVATYKGAPLLIKGKGVIVAPTLANTQIS
ncbi:aminoacyl tRNA synthase complex-interacting multifunctional protein 1 [Biomphalaria glabrata]|nr:aminoacyl tRNA synthase complex-interacting multifunctional protein 1 [Biomphalaria glabrata]